MDIRVNYWFKPKPCPKCGNISCSLCRVIDSKNSLLINFNPAASYSGYSEMMWFKVKCDACDYSSEDAHTEDAAIYNWNNDKNRKTNQQ